MNGRIWDIAFAAVPFWVGGQTGVGFLGAFGVVCLVTN